jgi:hypothetical protein
MWPPVVENEYSPEPVLGIEDHEVDRIADHLAAKAARQFSFQIFLPSPALGVAMRRSCLSCLACRLCLGDSFVGRAYRGFEHLDQRVHLAAKACRVLLP